MNIVKFFMNQARKEYKKQIENKTTIELMHITRAIRKGQVECQKV